MPVGRLMRIAFVDLSTKLETVFDLESKARGGMVSSLFKVSDYLARYADVTVLGDIELEGDTPAGVKWRKEPESPYDVLITNRGTGSGYSYIRAKHRILWTHDLPHLGFIPERGIIKAFTKTVFMSRYAERVWRAMYPDIGKSVLIPNGVDKSIFYPREKNLDSLIYISAPNRGLKRLPFMFDCLKSRIDRPLTFDAFSNLAKLHPNELRDGYDEFEGVYKEIHESDVTLHDPLPQEELAPELGEAGLMILPTQYPEICSNSILQSLASGTPIITTGNLGSAHEWVNDRNGRLTEFLPDDYMIYTVEMVRNAVEVLSDEKLHRKLIKGALNTKIHTWDEIGEKWWQMIKRLNWPF